jgi:hypothetical protein
MEKVEVLLADNQELTCHGIISILVSEYENALNITKINTKEDLRGLLKTIFFLESIFLHSFFLST